MTQEHPITPPPELVQQWNDQVSYYDSTLAVIQVIATQAANWGADQELEGCGGWLRSNWPGIPIEDLRAARRPKPPSLKEQALALIDECTDPHGDYLDDNALTIIRRALEQLDD